MRPSEIYSPLPMYHAINKGEQVLRSIGTWQAETAEQRQWLDQYYPAKSYLADFDDCIDSIAATNPKAIHNFLEAHGFDIKLGPFVTPQSIGIASILKLVFEWTQEGSCVFIREDPHEAEKLDEFFNGVSINEYVHYYRSIIHDHPVACISTKAGDQVYITKAPDEFLDGWKYIVNLDRFLTPLDGVYDKVSFPEVKCNIEKDCKELLKISITIESHKHLNGDNAVAVLEQALQQDKFEMGCKGGKIESAAAIELGISDFMVDFVSKPVMNVNGPFFLWFKRRNRVAFGGYFSKDSWSKYERKQV